MVYYVLFGKSKQFATFWDQPHFSSSICSEVMLKNRQPLRWLLYDMNFQPFLVHVSHFLSMIWSEWAKLSLYSPGVAGLGPYLPVCSSNYPDWDPAWSDVAPAWLFWAHDCLNCHPKDRLCPKPSSFGLNLHFGSILILFDYFGPI